jgi:uncharacterized protein
MATRADTGDRARNGTLAVSGGRVVVEPADAGGRAPLLDWEDGVAVLIDGLPPVSRPCQVLYGQSVEAWAPDAEPRIELFAELLHDDMAATLSVERHPGGRFRLEDRPPNRELVIRRLLVERIPCPAPDADRVHAFLASHGIIHGVREDVVERCLNGVALAEQVAWGTRSVEPEDGELTLAAQLASAEGGGLWSVPAGTVLAVQRLPVPGEPGWTVRGDLVSVRAPRSVAIEIGDNVLVSSDGTRLVSAIDGFPRVGDGRIDVASSMRLDRDLDDHTGDLQAHGSVDLHGGVTEGRRLRVRRDLSVTGNIDRADVEVGGSATVHGIVMASKLRVGGLRGPATYLFQLVREIPGELERASALIGQLTAAAASKGQRLAPSQAASLVMSRYFAETARSLKQAAAYAAEQAEMLGPEPATALREAVTLLIAVESGSAPENGLEQAALTVALRTRALREALAEPVRLVACALQSSEIEIGGDLEITGRGAIGCTLRVLGNVFLESEGSTLRGGSLTLGGTARIRQLGSLGEKLTEVRLGPHARMIADVVHPGVMIELADGELVRFASAETNLDIGFLEAAA